MALNSNIALQLYSPNPTTSINLPEQEKTEEDIHILELLHIKEMLNFINERNDDCFINILLLKLLDINEQSSGYFNLIIKNSKDFFLDNPGAISFLYEDDLKIYNKLESNLPDDDQDPTIYIMIYYYYKVFNKYSDEFFKILTLHFNLNDYDKLKKYIQANNNINTYDTIILIDKILLNQKKILKIKSLFDKTLLTETNGNELIQNEKTYKKLFETLEHENYSEQMLDKQLSNLNIVEGVKKYGIFFNNIIYDISVIDSKIIIMIKNGKIFKVDDFFFSIISDGKKRGISSDNIEIKYNLIQINIGLNESEILEINYLVNQNLYSEYFPLPEFDKNIYNKTINTFLDFNNNDNSINWNITSDNFVAIYNYKENIENEEIIIQYNDLNQYTYDITIYRIWEEGSELISIYPFKNFYDVNTTKYFNNKEYFYKLIINDNSIIEELKKLDCYIFKIIHKLDQEEVKSPIFYNYNSGIRYNEINFKLEYIIIEPPSIEVYHNNTSDVNGGLYIENLTDKEITISNLVLSTQNLFDFYYFNNIKEIYHKLCVINYGYYILNIFRKNNISKEIIYSYVSPSNSNIQYQLYNLSRRLKREIKKNSNFLNNKNYKYINDSLNKQPEDDKNLLQRLFDFFNDENYEFFKNPDKQENPSAVKPYDDYTISCINDSHNFIMNGNNNEIKKGDKIFYDINDNYIYNHIGEQISNFPKNICINNDNKYKYANEKPWESIFNSTEGSILLNNEKNLLMYNKNINLKGYEVKELGKFLNSINNFSCDIIDVFETQSNIENGNILDDKQKCLEFQNYRYNNTFSDSITFHIDNNNNQTYFLNSNKNIIEIYDYLVVCNKELDLVSTKNNTYLKFPSVNCSFYKIAAEFQLLDKTPDNFIINKDIVTKYLVQYICVYETILINSSRTMKNEIDTIDTIITIKKLKEYLDAEYVDNHEKFINDKSGSLKIFIDDSKQKLHYSNTIIDDKFMFEIISIWYKHLKNIVDINDIPINKTDYYKYQYDIFINQDTLIDKDEQHLLTPDSRHYYPNLGQKNNYISKTEDAKIYKSAGGSFSLKANSIINPADKNTCLLQDINYEKNDFKVYVHSPIHTYVSPWTHDMTSWVKIKIIKDN